MAKGNAYARLVKSMRSQGAHSNEMPLGTGTVISTRPLTVRYAGVTASAVSSIPAVSGNVIQDLESVELPESLKGYFTAVYEKFNLSAGDTVMIQKSGSRLYVIGKVGI